ncbi:type I-B CRISPR-associated protein Cas7/Cst2/DevR [Blautia stercoris]|nr:type I-B CRISPR-associated protein Cas7/Cst2/DevR [Firmicutes bacterium AM10-47]RHV47381.1 type I-B CRISPR-associated protein Cas7/Cst2/DevR [Firmicutes bacterium OM04-13BH]
MKKNSLTLTVVANMTSNYSESLGNIASVQKVFKNRKIYSMRSRESLKNAIMVQSGMYDDLETSLDGAAQKKVSEELNASNCRALEGGYMNTQGTTYVRKSSFYLTDAVAAEHFVNETRFHNNLYLATNYAKEQGISVQSNGGSAGLMPYQYEYDKSLKIYSMTIDLEMIGKDENFHEEADAKEKAERVIALLDAVENLSLVVRGNLDNAEPVFVVGGLSERKTHYFENVVHVEEEKLVLSEDLKIKLERGFQAGLLRGNLLQNEEEIEKELTPVSVPVFFENLRKQVLDYYLEK